MFIPASKLTELCGGSVAEQSADCAFRLEDLYAILSTRANNNNGVVLRFMTADGERHMVIYGTTVPQVARVIDELSTFSSRR